MVSDPQAPGPKPVFLKRRPFGVAEATPFQSYFIKQLLTRNANLQGPAPRLPTSASSAHHL
jgi:hypothetical protein